MLVESDEDIIAKLEGIRNTLGDEGKTIEKSYLMCDRDSCQWVTHDQARRPHARQAEVPVTSTSGTEDQMLPTPYLHGLPADLNHFHDTHVEDPRLVSRDECANPEDCILTAVDKILDTLNHILDTEKNTLDIDKKILGFLEQPESVSQQNLETLNQILDTDKKTLETNEKILDLVESQSSRTLQVSQ